jgi:hypothetical protein
VFENRVLRKIIGPKREEILAGWRKLSNGEIHDYYYCQDNISVIISRMRWAGHVEGVERGKMETGF